MAKGGFALMARARASLAGPRLLIGGALCWGLVMVASYLVYEWRQTGLNRFHLATMLGIVFSGGVLGWISGLTCARFFGIWRRFETRLAATLFFLCIGTMGFTMVLLALQLSLIRSSPKHGSSSRSRPPPGPSISFSCSACRIICRLPFPH